MPTLSQLGLGLSDRTVNNIGSAAGLFPQPAVFNTIAQLGQTRGDPLAPYIGALGPRSVIGPARGSPGGLPTQATETPNLALTRERIQRALEDNPQLRALLDRTVTAEAPPNATSPERAATAATFIDRAVARGEPLEYTLTNPKYFPPQTLNSRAMTGEQVDPALFAGANPVNFATGNASLDPRTGRWVGFAGGPQTGTLRTGRGMELAGIEGQDLPYARAVGYTGPSSTPIGPSGPTGYDMANLSPTGGGWETTVGAAPAAGPTAVGYVNPAAVATGARTNPADLVRPAPQASLLGFLGDLQFVPPRPAQPPPPFRFDSRYQFVPLGGRRGRG
jgi:hypothetical protein